MEPQSRVGSDYDRLDVVSYDFVREKGIFFSLNDVQGYLVRMRWVRMYSLSTA